MAVPGIILRTTRRVGRSETHHVLAGADDKSVARHHSVGSIGDGKRPERMFKSARLIGAGARIRSINDPCALGGCPAVCADIIGCCLSRLDEDRRENGCGY